MGYHIKNVVESTVDLMIRKADHPKAISIQKLGALMIICSATIRTMLAAIQFYDEPGFEAYEVRDIGTNRLLAAEFEARELTAA